MLLAVFVSRMCMCAYDRASSIEPRPGTCRRGKKKKNTVVFTAKRRKDLVVDLGKETMYTSWIVVQS